MESHLKEGDVVRLNSSGKFVLNVPPCLESKMFKLTWKVAHIGKQIPVDDQVVHEIILDDPAMNRFLLDTGMFEIANE